MRDGSNNEVIDTVYYKVEGIDNRLAVLMLAGDRECQLPQNKSSTTIDLKSAAKAYDYEDGQLAVEWYAAGS